MKRPCSHCHLEYDENALFKKEINGKSEYFCCKGCEGVFMLLIESDLEVFYSRLGDAKLAPPKEYQSLSKFSDESFLQKYVKKIDENLCEVSLIIEEIHCVACIWLNQKVLNNASGIESVDINYTNNKAKIIYDRRKITLTQIIELIRSIGYNAQAYDPKTLESINYKERKSYYIRMIVGVFCTMNIMWIAVAQYLGYFMGMERDLKDILNLAAFSLATPTLFFSGWVFLSGGYYGLKNKIINMDLLVSIGALITYLYSIYAALTHSGETYFESLTMIITFILIGKFLEVKSRKSAGDSIDKLVAQIPQSLKINRKGEILTLSPEEVRVGDIIEALPGDKIIIDGILLSPKTLLDSSMLTGESEFVSKTAGEALISGSINIDYAINYRATKTFSQSMMNNIINIIQDSMNSKPRIQERANAISYHFSSAVFLAAVGTFIAWYLLSGSIERGIVVAVSVIIIACPCALALATPIASIRGISEAYKNKLLFKESRFLETMAKSNAIIFDKTGTLTYGSPKVVQVEEFGKFDRAVLLAFLRCNTHPISNGVAEYLAEASPLGMQCGEIADFVECTDTKSANIPQNPQNSHSHTANARSLEASLDSSDLQNRNKINLHEVQRPLKASSGVRERVVREGEGSDFAIQAPFPSLKIKSIKNPCEKDSNKNNNLEYNENPGLSLRGEAEAIQKVDCHDSAFAESRNDRNTESLKDSTTSESLSSIQNLKSSNNENPSSKIQNFKLITQRGIKAEYNGKILLGGSKKFLQENGISLDFNNSDFNNSPKQNPTHSAQNHDNDMKFYYAIDRKLVAIFSLKDTIKDNAKSVIGEFMERGFRVAILSGDRLEVVESVAKSLGVSEFYYEQTPMQKSEFIEKLHEQGLVSIMVGDGINDSIAMNKSDIAISMGQGSDIAINYSDIVLLDNSLQSLLDAYHLSLQTYSVIRQNITISIVYNALTIPLAAFGLVIPLFAALSMSFSSLLVTLNSSKIRLRRGK